MNKNKAFLLALPAIGAAFLAVLSQLTISIGPVPITLQTFAVGLIATIFKPREAVLSVFIYLLCAIWMTRRFSILLGGDGML